MRIAYIAADRGTPVFGPKGASVHIRAMSNALAQLGHQLVLYVAQRGSGDSPLQAEVVEVAARMDLADAPASGDARTVLKERRAVDQAAQIAQRVALDHGQHPFDLIYERYALFSDAGVCCAERLGIPCLVEVNAPLLEEQGTHRRLVNHALASQVRERVFRHADALLPVSDALFAYALEQGADPARVHVIANGIDPHLFHPQAAPLALPQLAGKRVIGFSGSLKPWHGLDILLDAFRDIAVGYPERHLLIVGEGPLRGWIEGYAAGAGISAQVTVTGWVPLEQVAGYLRCMELAVAPYPPSDDFYFSPLKLFEYLATGTAVIASRIGQIETSLRDGVDALLVRPGDRQQLAEAMVRLLGQPQLRRQLGLAAAQTGSERTWPNNARRVMAIANPLLQVA